MSVTQEDSPSAVAEDVPSVSTIDSDGIHTLHNKLSKYAWYRGNQPGVIALQYFAELEKDPNLQTNSINSLRESVLDHTPGQFDDYYKKRFDPQTTALEEARLDILDVIDNNLSPEVRTQIEDLKLFAADVLGLVAQLGFLPFFDQDQFVKKITKAKYGIHGQFDEQNDGWKAAFARRDLDEIGSIGLANMLEPGYFVHEVTHLGIEAYKPGLVDLGNCCNSVREATVQHIADRACQPIIKALPRLAGGKKYGPYRRLDEKAEFARTRFTHFDQKGVYEADRRILYELCEGDVELQDFINALSDPSFNSTNTLIEKLIKQFPDLPIFFSKDHKYDTPLSIIQSYVDGPHAEKLSGGLKERHERAEYVLKKIWRYKNKRDLEQAWTARSAAKKAYAHARKVAISAHSSYLS